MSKIAKIIENVLLATIDAISLSGDIDVTALANNTEVDILAALWTSVEDGLPHDYCDTKDYIVGTEHGDEIQRMKGYAFRRLIESGDSWFTHYYTLMPPKEVI